MDSIFAHILPIAFTSSCLGYLSTGSLFPQKTHDSPKMPEWLVFMSLSDLRFTPDTSALLSGTDKSDFEIEVKCL